MKTGIHPKIVSDAQVVCSCGAVFTTTSTKPTVSVDVCWKCHPFYTGEHRFIDTKGRVENFQKKQEYASSMKDILIAKKLKKKKNQSQDTKTLKELLSEM